MEGIFTLRHTYEVGEGMMVGKWNYFDVYSTCLLSSACVVVVGKDRATRNVSLIEKRMN